jgi:hypothetical protein
VSLVPKDDKGKEPHIVALKADPTYVVIYPTCQPLVDVLLKVFDRHIRRNQIHHDPEFMRATMDETQACEALADAVKLAVILYPEVQNELVSNYLSHALWLWFRLHAKYMQTKDYKIEKEINRIFAEKVSAGGGKRVRNRGCHLLEDRDFGFKWLNLRHESADLVPLLNAAATKFGV